MSFYLHSVQSPSALKAKIKFTFPLPCLISVHPDYLHSNFSRYFKTVYMSVFSASTPLSSQSSSHWPVWSLTSKPMFHASWYLQLVTSSAGCHTEGACFLLNWFSHSGSWTGSRNLLSKDKWTETLCCRCYSRKSGETPTPDYWNTDEQQRYQADAPISISQMRKRSLKSMELKDNASLRSSEK